MTILTIEGGSIANGFITYEDGTEYDGSIFDAVPHGKGLLKNAEGHIYEGTFFYGKPQGTGIWITPDGVKVFGVWEYGQFKVLNGGEQ